jgi:hypothetical protein
MGNHNSKIAEDGERGSGSGGTTLAGETPDEHMP